MKKKLSTLVALATVVTIGGVYATWTFAEGQAPTASTTVNVAMTGATSSTEKGTLSVMVMGENGFTLAIDDSDNNHIAEIMKSGVVTVTFTPSATASEDVKTNGIDVSCVISYAPYTNGPATLEDWKYDSKQIFDIENDEATPILLNKSAAVKDPSTGVFTWTITSGEVGIDLANEFKIDTYAKYEDMNEELAKGHFVLTVSEYTATVNN